MLRFGRRIGVAVSGGADSVFLLHALAELGLAGAVIHVNHQLRGAEADADEAFVVQLAYGFGLPFHVARLPVSDGNVEQEARRLRYDFFRKSLEAGLIDAVATGHTLDDQAETVLARFFRGAGTAGLSGIYPVTSERVIRPQLELRRDQIREFLRSRQIGWREDRTNADTGFIRNRIRLELMPQLAAINPSLPTVLASTAEWARDEESYWKEEVSSLEAKLFLEDSDALLLCTRELLELPLSPRRRLIRRAIERVKGSLRSIGFEHVEAVLRVAEAREGSARVQIPGIDAYRSFDWLRLAPPGFDTRLERNFEIPITVPGHAAIPARRIDISLQTLKMELVIGGDVYNKQVNVLDGSQCAGALTLRNWHPGDSYTPANCTQREKIKTLFQQDRVPLWERRNWPVLAKGDSIVWTRRFGAAAEYAASYRSVSAFSVRESEESLRTLATSKESCRRQFKEVT